MYKIRKQFKFEGAHQLHEAYSTACTDSIHGHSYLVEVFFTGEQLDETGMVIDFGKINSLFKRYIDNYWDHALIMPVSFSDEYLNILKRYNNKINIVSYNPTAENMACEMFKTFNYILIDNSINVKLDCVRVHETTTGWAEYSE
jgi:6-pyruvoyltetrahydropterin/6-carboxytetrahydropterin synthase